MPHSFRYRFGHIVVTGFLATLLLLTFSCFASAQLYTGSIAGTITDPSGAVISDAQVKAVDQEKGFAFTGKTDSSGRYVVRQVPPGTYAVTVEATGFQSQRKDSVVLNVNDNISENFALKVGAASQVVDVTTSAVQLQTEDAVTGQVVDRRLINDLPLVGRSVLDLAYLASPRLITSAKTAWRTTSLPMAAATLLRTFCWTALAARTSSRIAAFWRPLTFHRSMP